MALAGCSKEDVSDNALPGSGTKATRGFTAEIASSRTTLNGDATRMKWTAGDQLGFYTDVETDLNVASSTYAEVLVLLGTFLAAAIINMGTNFLMGKISFVSNSVAIVLQLALSVDYAIIYCNRYKEEHKTKPIRQGPSTRSRCPSPKFPPAA